MKGLSKEQRAFENIKPLCNELRLMMTIKEKFGNHDNVVSFVGALTSNFQKRNLFIISFLLIWFDVRSFLVDIYIVMEFCKNGSLKEYLANHRRELIMCVNGTQRIGPQAYKWSKQIADGMFFLVENKVSYQ